MKKYIIIAIVALATVFSCQTDEEYEELNRDPKNPTQVAADFLFTSATVNLMDQMATPNVNLNIFRFMTQYWTTTTYLDEPNYNITERNIAQFHWSRLYRTVIFNLQDAKRIVSENPDLTQAEIDARIGQMEVLEVYAWHVLVDSFGDIPYSQALNAQEFPLPAYDDDQEIYQDLIARLDAADALLQAGQGFAGSDMIYGGNMEAWNRFANSLQLRLAMRISDVNPSLSQQTAEDAIADGVFTSNEQSATLEYPGSPPYANPLWEDLVQSGRSDYLAADVLVDIMNDLDDPRRDEYFDENLGEGVFEGGEYGLSNPFSNFTHVGERLREPTREGILLDYAEVEFYQAEAAERGYSTPMSAEEHYEAAITASILYWDGTEEEADSYLSQSEVAYDSANWQEQIGTQFWIAMYDNPFQGWSVYRKYDAPDLVIAPDSERPVPLRLTYPINEQNLNEENYIAASQAIGGDEQQTPVFWDVD